MKIQFRTILKFPEGTMTAVWKTKLYHSGQTLSILLNILALVVLLLNTGLQEIVVLRLVGFILLVDFVAELAKLIIIPANPAPNRAKWESAARTASTLLNILALGMVFLPLGLDVEVVMRVVVLIILVDLVVEITEWVLMK
jgi:hypothetical protein